MNHYTPGRWKCIKGLGERFLIFGGLNFLCSLESRVPPLENEANANLIASAPELLEALINLMNACYKADLHEELSEIVDGRLLDAAETAIAKAKGEVGLYEVIRPSISKTHEAIAQLEEGSFEIDVLVESKSGFGIHKQIVKVTDIATGISVEESADKSLHRNVVVAKEKLAKTIAAIAKARGEA